MKELVKIKKLIALRKDKMSLPSSAEVASVLNQVGKLKDINITR